MLQKTPAGLEDSISLKLVLQEEYETIYGICNHDDVNKNPLALVSMHPKENVASRSKLYNTIRRYDFHEIYQKFGVSLPEFLGLPHEYVELLFQMSAEKAKEKQPGIDKVLKDLEKDR